MTNTLGGNFIGGTIAVVAAIASNIGVNLQKRFHERRHTCQQNGTEYWKHLSWWWGFLLVTGAALGDFVALIYGTQELVAALGGGTTLVVNIFAASIMNKEQMYLTDFIGVGLVLIAVVILSCVVNPSVSYDLKEIRHLVISPVFIVYFLLQILIIIIIRNKGLNNAMHELYNFSSQIISERPRTKRKRTKDYEENYKNMSTTPNKNEEKSKQQCEENTMPHEIDEEGKEDSMRKETSYTRTSSLRSDDEPLSQNQVVQSQNGSQQSIKSSSSPIGNDVLEIHDLSYYWWNICAFVQQLRRKCKNQEEQNNNVKKSFFIRYMTFSFAAISGTIGGMSILISKWVGEIIASTVRGRTRQLLQPDLFVYLIGMILTILLQTHYLNKAMISGDVSVAFPIFQAFWIGSSVLSGVIFYQQIYHFTLQQIFIYPLSLVLMIIGVGFLLRHQQQSSLELQTIPESFEGTGRCNSTDEKPNSSTVEMTNLNRATSDMANRHIV